MSRLDSVVVRNVGLSMAGLCCGQKGQLWVVVTKLVSVLLVVFWDVDLSISKIIGRLSPYRKIIGGSQNIDNRSYLKNRKKLSIIFPSNIAQP
jgi:hypothetical protein